MIVVTGATGRTGRAATVALLAKGAKVRVVGREETFCCPRQRSASMSLILSLLQD